MAEINENVLCLCLTFKERHQMKMPASPQIFARPNEKHFCSVEEIGVLAGNQ